MSAVVEILLTDLLALNERGFYTGFLALTWALGTVLGPILGGAIAQRTTWKWFASPTFSHDLTNPRIFYLNVPAVGIILIGNWFFLTLKKETSSIKDKLKRIDFIGIIIFLISLMCLLFSLTSGGVIEPWTSPKVVIPLIIAVIGLIIFWFFEERVPREPMIPPRVFKERTALAGYIGTWIHGMILWGFIYFALLWVNTTPPSICCIYFVWGADSI